MHKQTVWQAVLIALVIAGCATERIYRSNPVEVAASNNFYEVKLEPLRAEGYNYFNRFRFVFKNKTNKDLIIDWSETYYLQNGRKNGHFGRKEMTFDELKEVNQSPDITIAPGDTRTNEIFPLQLLGWRERSAKVQGTTPEAGFDLGVVPVGENGMDLAVRQDGKLFREKIFINITLD
jgi:hypothetical protein